MAKLLGAYYNEHDPKAAAWLRELIKGGHIAPGEVDERDIRDVTPDDLAGFIQHHFFAGIGVWSYALRQAGWPDDRPVWTGSCPCQPFSSAGKRKGTADDRHLWPAWMWLIRQCRPDVVFGEQVASPDGIAWLDTVSTDLEAEGYAAGPVVLPACGVGAPHIRQRLWFVADTDGSSSQWGTGGISGEEAAVDRARIKNGSQSHGPADGSQNVGMAHPTGEQCDPGRVRAESIESGSVIGPARHGAPGGTSNVKGGVRPTGAGPTNGIWGTADWIFCRDGKWRPVEPGSFPLAHGAAGRVGRLRGYGNAIVAQAAAEVIAAYMEVRGG